jgi:hypothetical protein
MAAAYFLQQVSDTILSPQEQVGVTSEELQADPHDSAVNLFQIEHPGDLIRRETRALFPVPIKTEEVRPQPPARKIIRPQQWNFNGNVFQDNPLTRVLPQHNARGELSSTALATAKPERVVVQPRNQHTYDWFLAIFMLITLLFIWIRVFYGKFFSMLGNALLSFQISAKLFREKNALHRRVSIVLDFIYLVVLSVFVFELARYFDILDASMSRFNQFMLILNIFMLYTLLRLLLLKITAFLFLNRSLFSEYIHNTFVVNKGMGIALFPLVVTIHYFPPALSALIVFTGIVIVGAAFIFKSVRAYQIIKRKDVLLFYLILYLCTLEFLPLLLGYKVIISLI